MLAKIFRKVEASGNMISSRQEFTLQADVVSCCWRERSEGRTNSCRPMREAKLRPQIREVRLLLGPPEELILAFAAGRAKVRARYAYRRSAAESSGELQVQVMIRVPSSGNIRNLHEAKK